MTEEKKELVGIEILRRAVNRFGWCREDFLWEYSVAELLKIDDAWSRSGWDFYPDQWTKRQITEAIKYGRAPTWDSATETPSYEPRANLLPRWRLWRVGNENLGGKQWVSAGYVISRLSNSSFALDFKGKRLGDFTSLQLAKDAAAHDNRERKGHVNKLPRQVKP